METELPAPDRTYPCSYGCGNQIDVILTQVDDSTTLMLCIPCFVLTAQQVLEAMVNPESPDVKARIADAGPVDRATRARSASAKTKRPEDQDPSDPDYIAPFQGFDDPEDDDSDAQLTEVG